MKRWNNGALISMPRYVYRTMHSSIAKRVLKTGLVQPYDAKTVFFTMTLADAKKYITWHKVYNDLPQDTILRFDTTRLDKAMFRPDKTDIQDGKKTACEYKSSNLQFDIREIKLVYKVNEE